MARANVRTWLSVDEWGTIMGLNPLHLNRLSSTFFNNTTCGELFYQHAYQHSDRVGIEEIAMAIQQAEQNMSREVGYNLMPDWTIDERLIYPRPGIPEVYNTTGTNPRGKMKSVEASKGMLISGGVRTKSLIQAGAAIVRSDVDSDGYQETCTVTVATSVTDEDEIHLYYPSQSGNDFWEIRPINVTISGGNAVITFKIWQVVAANQLDRLDASPLDADQAASFETTVDVYRVYNYTGTQVQFLWENEPVCSCGSTTCNACQLGTQDGCFHLRDARLGFVVPYPATYSDGDWTAADVWSACREPDQVRLYYYSGYRDNNTLRPYAELSPYWKYAVAYYAASLLDRPVCGCSNVSEYIEKWRKDAAFGGIEQGGFNLTQEQLSNRLGTTFGALYAWRRIHQTGVIINK